MRGFLKIYGYEDKTAKTGWNIKTGPQQLISSFLQVGTIIGVLLTHLWARKFGRRPAIWFASLISFVAAGIQIGTDNLVGLYFGRILIGMSNGFFITFANVYTAEVSPAHLRGPIVSFFGVWTSTGSILGATANDATKGFDSKLSYRIPLASLYAIPFFLCVLLIFLPESPRWLLVQGCDEQALQSLKRLRGNSFKGQEHLLQEEFLEMQQGIRQEEDLSGGNVIGDMFRGTDLRRTLICFGVIVSHTSSGIWLLVGYGVGALSLPQYSHIWGVKALR
jgi:MFS family permease